GGSAVRGQPVARAQPCRAGGRLGVGAGRAAGRPVGRGAHRGRCPLWTGRRRGRGVRARRPARLRPGRAPRRRGERGEPAAAVVHAGGVPAPTAGAGRAHRGTHVMWRSGAVSVPHWTYTSWIRAFVNGTPWMRKGGGKLGVNTSVIGPMLAW